MTTIKQKVGEGMGGGCTLLVYWPSHFVTRSATFFIRLLIWNFLIQREQLQKSVILLLFCFFFIVSFFLTASFYPFSLFSHLLFYYFKVIIYWNIVLIYSIITRFYILYFFLKTRKYYVGEFSLNFHIFIFHFQVFGWVLVSISYFWVFIRVFDWVNQY